MRIKIEFLLKMLHRPEQFFDTTFPCLFSKSYISNSINKLTRRSSLEYLLQIKTFSVKLLRFRTLNSRVHLNRLRTVLENFGNLRANNHSADCCVDKITKTPKASENWDGFPLASSRTYNKMYIDYCKFCFLVLQFFSFFEVSGPEASMTKAQELCLICLRHHWFFAFKIHFD